MRPLMRGVTIVAAILLSGATVFVAGESLAQHSMQHDKGQAPATYQVGDLVITDAWSRATPKGAPVAGGYLKITNTGSVPDRLVGGSFPGAAKVEVHQMTMDRGVMQMRPLTNGLEIKPGETVELGPGGYHLMFMGFKGQLKPHDRVKGTLRFEKAGTVELTYRVAPMGAPRPATGTHSGH